MHARNVFQYSNSSFQPMNEALVICYRTPSTKPMDGEYNVGFNSD